jgi:hypothetical protein
MTIEPKTKVIHSRSGGTTGGILWTAGWMFTIAFAKLIWWKALLAIVIWPWYLALAVR